MPFIIAPFRLVLRTVLQVNESMSRGLLSLRSVTTNSLFHGICYKQLVLLVFILWIYKQQNCVTGSVCFLRTNSWIQRNRGYLRHLSMPVAGPSTGPNPIDPQQLCKKLCSMEQRQNFVKTPFTVALQIDLCELPATYGGFITDLQMICSRDRKALLPGFPAAHHPAPAGAKCHVHGACGEENFLAALNKQLGHPLLHARVMTINDALNDNHQ